METIRIDSLGAAGDGVGEGPVYAPFTLPGETARGEIVDGRMEVAEILSPSPDRAQPPCPHFGRCGGCALQHAGEDLVAEWKRGLVARALAQRGIESEVRPTITSPLAARRRAVFTARRTKKTVIIGFHARRSDEVIGIGACPVLRPEIMAALSAVEAAAKLGASRKGAIRATVTASEGGIDLAVEDAKPLEGAGFAAAAALAENGDLARLAWNREIIATRRPPHQRMGPALVAPPPGGFLQATSEGEAALLAAAREAVGAPWKLVDLFSGAGAFTLPFAETAEVHAVEADPTLLAALDDGWRRVGGLARVTTEARDLFRRPLLAEELNAYDAAIMDPPRAGAKAQAEEIAVSALTRLASLSCDPGSFARDARILIDGGWRLDWAQPIDQFRWSAHVEIAARFSRP